LLEVSICMQTPIKCINEVLEHKMLTQYVYTDAGYLLELLELCTFRDFWSPDFYL
jgi:hypothetical protein